MGNIALNGSATPADALVEEVFESSLASDLQARLQAFVDGLIAGTGQIVDANLVGAGDGHAFVCTVLYNPAGTPPVAGTLVRFYSAASEPAFRAAAAAALASLQGQALQVSGHGEAGASQGRRWMGMFIAEPLPA